METGFDEYGREIEDKTISIQEQSKKKYFYKSKGMVFDGIEFLNEIDSQIKALEKKGIEPYAILIKSYGFMILRHQIKTSEKERGTLQQIGDTGNVCLTYLGLPIYNTSLDREDCLIKIDNLNYVKVVGS